MVILKQKLTSFLFYTAISAGFILFGFFSFFLATLGWLITRWDPMGWLDTNNFTGISFGPIMFFFSCLIAIFTLQILVSRKTVNKIYYLLFSLPFASALGLWGVFSIPIGLILSTNVSIGDPTFWVPIWGVYIELFVILAILGVYLSWYEPSVENETEIQAWREYLDDAKIPTYRWLLVYFIVYIIGISSFIMLLLFIGSLFPNVFTSYYFEDQEKYIVVGLALIFFPGLFLHTVSFVIYYWRPIKTKMDLYLIESRSKANEFKRTPMNQINTNRKGNYNQKEISGGQNEETEFKKAGWFEIAWITFADSIFLIVFYVMFSGSWLPSLIYAIWAWVFLFIPVFSTTIALKFGLINESDYKGKVD
ncbi:MAG: hypothetical protein ACFFFG_15890 [Candidatus Thorarchaeota archaeon]